MRFGASLDGDRSDADVVCASCLKLCPIANQPAELIVTSAWTASPSTFLTWARVPAAAPKITVQSL